MKGWIKVHGITFDDKIQEQWVRSSDVMAVGRGTLASDEKRKATCITLRGDSSTYPVTESIRKVLDLISVAENTALLEKLVKLKNECEEQKARGGLCIECKGRGLCYALQGEPRYWSMKRIKEELEKIPEEYR